MRVNVLRPRNIEARERERRAIELRKCGWSYRRIAATMGISAVSAGKMVKRVIERINEKSFEDASVIRQIELERLDEMLEAIWPAARAGDLDHGKRVLDIMERRSALLGLDAPKKVEVEDTTDIDAQLNRLIERAQSRRQVPPTVEVDGPPKSIDSGGKQLVQLGNHGGTWSRQDAERG